MENLFDLFDIIFYVTDAITNELIWVNKFCKEKYGEIFPGLKVYNYLFGLDEPNNYLNPQIVKDPKTESLYLMKSVNEKSSNKDLNYGIGLKVDDVFKLFNEYKDFKMLFNDFLNSVSKIDVDSNEYSKLQRICKGIKKVFKADRVLIIKDNFKSIIECKKKSLEKFKFTEDLLNIVKGFKTKSAKNKEKFIYYNAKTLKNMEQYELVDKFEIINLYGTYLNISDTDFYLLIFNAKNKIRNAELYNSLYRFLYFLLCFSRYNAMLYKSSITDTLTKCYNRNYFNKVLEKLSKEERANTGVIYIDLDELKTINDKFGHKTGDIAIISVAEILKGIFNKEEIFKVGGDEFIVIKQNCSFIDFDKSVKKLERKLKDSNYSSSYGSCYRADNAILEDMIEIAENEMYLLKNRHHYLSGSNLEQNFFVNDLRKNIMNKKFILLLQPKIDPYKNKLESAEVLVRGIGNQNEILSPNEFIPYFEKNNCIDLLDYFVIEETCILYNKLRSEYGFSNSISVNISRQTLLIEPFHKDMRNMFSKYNIPYDKIIFEITEKMDVSLDAVLKRVGEMFKDGFHFEIDDFGSYFTNIGFLSIDGFDAIKLDKSLVRKISSVEFIRDVIICIINKCQEKNIKVIAEGVENKEEVEYMKKMKIDLIQGYFYDKPLMIEDFINKYLLNLK